MGPGRRLGPARRRQQGRPHWSAGDRKSTRLNSSHQIISYAVFCLKKKKKKMQSIDQTILECIYHWNENEGGDVRQDTGHLRPTSATSAGRALRTWKVEWLYSAPDA